MINKEIFKKTLEKNPFEPINEMVYQYLRRSITLLELEPGEKLKESQISEELNISRSPVKSALQRLERENLIERKGGKICCVSKIKYEDCRSLVEARKAIEGMAAYYAAGRITEKELEQLKTLLLQFKCNNSPPSPVKFAQTDDQFHQLIVCSCRNTYLQEAYGLIQSNMLRYRLYIMQRLELSELHEYESHLPVYIALKNRFATLAREEILLSIDHMYESIRIL